MSNQFPQPLRAQHQGPTSGPPHQDFGNFMYRDSQKQKRNRDVNVTHAAGVTTIPSDLLCKLTQQFLLKKPIASITTMNAL